jgi:hypothetical protein
MASALSMVVGLFVGLLLLKIPRTNKQQSHIPRGLCLSRQFSCANEAAMLTEAAIRKAGPKGKPYRFSDREVFYLLATPSRAKLWRVNCRLGEAIS